MTPALDKKYNKTLIACFIGYIVQSIVVIFVPLLFLHFKEEFGLSLMQISALISVNFAVQLTVDAIAAFFVDRIGYRISALMAMGFAFAGLFSMSFLPDILPSAFAGLLTSVVLYAIGGGLIEVIISPIVESCPTPNKETAMSMLHSFYCWGCVGVIALSTLYFHFIGIQNWRYALVLWSIIPFANAIYFLFVPLCPIVGEDEEKIPISKMFTSKIFWLFIILMVCSGASEQAMHQWSSVYAEETLGIISKTVGDIAGPMLFAVCAGIIRSLYGKYGEKINLYKVLAFSGLLSIISYLILGFTSSKIMGLIGCSLCGIAMALMWPGTLSVASKYLRRCGTALFSFLALAGDLGCSSGPALVGLVSDNTGGNLKAGFLGAIVFPLILFIAYIFLAKYAAKNSEDEQQ